VTYATDYVNYTKTWMDVSTPSWLINAWSPWVAAAPNRRLVIGVPLLINSAAGQLSAGAAGSFDGYFRTLAQNLVSNHLGSSVLRLGYEMNHTGNSWYTGSDWASLSGGVVHGWRGRHPLLHRPDGQLVHGAQHPVPVLLRRRLGRRDAGEFPHWPGPVQDLIRAILDHHFDNDGGQEEAFASLIR